MLNNVPVQINRAARQVVLRHPNSQDCTLWRKVVNRTSETDDFSGTPTIGGIGVLDSEDEADYRYEEVGDAKIVFTGQYAASQSNMIDTEDGLNYPEPPSEALIECVLALDHPQWFMPDKPMVVTVFPGNGVVVVFQIVGTTGTVNVPPYTRKYLMNPMADSSEWPVDQDGNPPTWVVDDDTEWKETQW